MAFALSPFAHQKQITERCSLWDTFTLPYPMFMNDVTVTSSK